VPPAFRRRFAGKAGIAAIGAIAVVALAVSFGCASAGGGAAAEARTSALADAPEVTARQIMVTLPPGSPGQWSQVADELQMRFRLKPVFAWSFASISERCLVFEVTGGRPPAEVATRVATDPRVKSAEPIQLFTALGGRGRAGQDAPVPAAPPAPPAAAGRSSYSRLQYAPRTLHLEEAHRWATGKGVRVAVVDTGVDLTHPDLRSRVVKASNFVDRGEQTFTSDIHGTAVAGVIAAAAASESGISGAAPEAEIFALKACWPQTPGARQAVCNSYTLAKAIDFAIVERAQVLNFSLAGPQDPILDRLIRAAIKRGIVVVAAQSPDRQAGRSFPASVEGVIAVLDTDVEGGLRSPPPPPHPPLVAAPGVDILTTAPHGSYDFFSGSSLAAGEVSGVVALLLEKNPKLSPAQLKALLEKTAHPVKGAPGDADPAVGLIDACAALGQLVPGAACP